MMETAINSTREIRFIRVCVLATIIAFAGIYGSIATHTYAALHSGHIRPVIALALFSLTILFVGYGIFLYQLCLVGYHKRRIAHLPASREMLESIYDASSPSLAILVPSYKEELAIVRQTLLSAALAEYPQKSVVLLIDDPFLPRALEDFIKLEKARQLTDELQELFDVQLSHYRAEEEKFKKRCEAKNIFHAIELNRLSLLFDDVAQWLEGLAANCRDGRDTESLTHGEQFFLSRIIQAPAQEHRVFAQQLRDGIVGRHIVSEAYLARQYARLSSIFNVNFSRFERKKYVNLSHESNKAMNLNSFIGLMGKSWCEVEVHAGLELRECKAEDADFSVAGFDFVNTIDADTLMTSDYVLRLIHEMRKPGRDRLAVAQSPCSSIPGCPHVLERAAGAFIDIQFLTHQGYTHWGAGFWVGANAMLRREALEDIKEIRQERGYDVAVYIQDRTVIEDTESTIDLVFKGWQIYNYPKRMTFSPTPPDFGSLLIQRRRWANGGLIILPKLLSYVMGLTRRITIQEFLIRFSYLASTTLFCLTTILFMAYPFGDVASSFWLPLLTLPALLLFARDLKKAGYQYTDVLRIYAINMMLIPVVMGGVAKQFQQILTGKKIPFGRTPKVPGRTAAPLLYYLFEILMFAGFSAMTFNSYLHAHWAQLAFSSINMISMGYVLTHLIGVKAMMQDLAASVSMYWRRAFHRAVILPLPARWAAAADASIRIRA